MRFKHGGSSMRRRRLSTVHGRPRLPPAISIVKIEFSFLNVFLVAWRGHEE